VLLVRTTNVGRDEGSGGSTSEQDGEDASEEALSDTRVDADDNRCEDEDDCQAEEGVHDVLLKTVWLGLFPCRWFKYGTLYRSAQHLGKNFGKKLNLRDVLEVGQRVGLM
jgi:hypothetical protein